MPFSIGQEVRIPCRVQPGPFEEELQVSIKVEDEFLSGFVNKDSVVFIHEKAFLRATIIGVAADSVKVKMPGSFFTVASGLASVPEGWARTNLVAA